MVVVRCLILCSKFVKNRLSAWFTALSRPLDKSWGEGRGKGKRKGRREGNGRGRGDEERGRGEGEEGKEAGGREGGRRGIPRMKILATALRSIHTCVALRGSHILEIYRTYVQSRFVLKHDFAIEHVLALFTN